MSTDCAGMGIHVAGLRLVVNIGKCCIVARLLTIDPVIPRAAQEPLEGGPAGGEGGEREGQSGCLCDCPLARAEG